MKYSKSKRYTLKRGKKGKLRYHLKPSKSSKFTDYRRKQAIARDRATDADTIYPNTAKGRRMWKLNRGETDLLGYDTVKRRVKRLQAQKRKEKAQVRIKYKPKPKYETIRGYTGLTGVEEHHLLNYVKKNVCDPQNVDIKSLIDSSLSYAENKEIIETSFSPSCRDVSTLY